MYDTGGEGEQDTERKRNKQSVETGVDGLSRSVCISRQWRHLFVFSVTNSAESGGNVAKPKREIG